MFNCDSQPLFLPLFSLGGIDNATRKALLDGAGIPMGSSYVTAITNLKALGVDLTRVCTIYCICLEIRLIYFPFLSHIEKFHRRGENLQ